MPKAPRPCPAGDYTCGALVYGTDRHCPDHKPQAWRGPRTRSSHTTSTTEWKRLRRTILERDRYQCQIRYEGICIGHANQVDHVINTAAGGAPLDPANCTAACAPCNARKASLEGATARRNRRPQPARHPGLLR